VRAPKQEEYGWKLIHADVCRSPTRPLLLCVMVGTGAQLLGMASVTLLFALLGFLSPSNRGALGTTMVVTWTLFASLAGYFATRLHISFGREEWKKCVALTATCFPAVVFASIL
jgi:transmembrane 9 superfamily protein 2/4